MKQLPCDTAVVLRPYFGEMTSFLDSRGGMPYVYIIVYIYIYAAVRTPNWRSIESRLS